MTQETCDIILVAGGSSSRFKGGLPKQFEPVNGRPLYLWSLDTFLNWELVGSVVVVVPEEWVDPVRQSFKILDGGAGIQVVKGGSSRQTSATLGLEALERVSSNSWVMIHDAARPCLSDELLGRIWDARSLDLGAGDIGGVIPGLPANETVKLVEHRERASIVLETLPRANLMIIQTPQLLKREILKEAYRDLQGLDAVDDACLVEKRGFKIVVVDGDYDNVKVTFSEDIDRVSSWLRKRYPQV
jgi:2-C-methyl-D-erythritol 4-phosphate cytidylyltransferase